ncbi:hypothetical protein L1987_63667 [Smallanthus sonchifolius]|uniref:Uncharacterized protein n=1 Tax=Smallanthus sonchifolius TaxID=185202 RepID=A0ACB9CE95_9ASTR|nr:hypothetical protein L1987_63667 [Smallanthus sonchifolius]
MGDRSRIFNERTTGSAREPLHPPPELKLPHQPMLAPLNCHRRSPFETLGRRRSHCYKRPFRVSKPPPPSFLSGLSGGCREKKRGSVGGW